MASGKTPWSEYNFDNPVEALLKIGVSNEIPSFPDNVSENLNNFIMTSL